jgi:PAS domain S-box-containing protein
MWQHFSSHYADAPCCPAYSSLRRDHLRVLAVDDQEYIRHGIRAVLSDTQDIEICGEAINGSDAIAKAEQLRPDVILMDISMPGLDGLEATREVHRILPSVQVVTVSQYDIPGVMKEALEAGASVHVSKLVIWTELVPVLRRLQNGEPPPVLASSPRAHLIPAAPGKGDLQEQLRESEERFMRTFEQTAVGMGHVAEDGRWLRVNQKLCQMVGYTKQELQQLSYQYLTHPADLSEDLAQSSRIAAGELDRYSLDKRYVRKDGGIIWVRVTVNAVRDAQGKLKYCVRVAEDRTAAKQAQENLAQSLCDLRIAAGHLNLVTDRMGAALTRSDRNLRYVWVNQNYANWLEQPVDKIVGRPIVDVLGKEAFQKLRPRFEQVLAGKSIQFQEQLVYLGIGLRRISAAYTPTLDSAGSADGWLALVQDITPPSKPVEPPRTPVPPRD